MLKSRKDRWNQFSRSPKHALLGRLPAVAFAAVTVCAGGLCLAQQSPPAQLDPAEGPQFQSTALQQAEVEVAAKTDMSQPLPPQVLSVSTEQDQLQVIQRRSQLLTMRGNIVRTAIADPSVIEMIQYSPNEISIIGLEIGSTTLTLWCDDNPQPLIYLVSTVPDPSLEERLRIDYGKLEQKLAVVFPDSKVYLIPLSGKILVKGQARDSKEAADILEIIRGEVINQMGSLLGPQPVPAIDVAGYQRQILNPLDMASTYIVNMLQVPGEFQVALRVRIAELSREQLRRSGIDFEYLINDGRHAVTWAAGGATPTLTGVFENGEVNLLVDLLASNGTAKILAEPVLTVLSGHSASFLSGGEFAVPTIVGIGGAQGQQTTFRGFGTSLLVTPVVLDKDLVRMTIVPEFSRINGDNTVGNIPGLDSRRVQTTVELREGQTIVIAGLISNQTSTEVTRIPFLSELPYVGAKLFSGKRATQDQSELLILVTPELVRPMDADEVPPVPGFEITHPSEYELCHLNMTEGVPDTGVYQSAPYGSGSSYGIDVGYNYSNPAPATPQYAPVPTNPYGVQYVMPPGGNYAPTQPQHVTPPPTQVVPQSHFAPQPQATPQPRFAPQPQAAPQSQFAPQPQVAPPSAYTPPQPAWSTLPPSAAAVLPVGQQPALRPVPTLQAPEPVPMAGQPVLPTLSTSPGAQQTSGQTSDVRKWISGAVPTGGLLPGNRPSQSSASDLKPRFSRFGTR